jgi:hypothetical protein
MRRTWSHRLFTTLFTLWFALVGAGPVALDACPTHGMGVPASKSAGQDHAAMHGGAHAMPAAHGAMAHHGGGDQHSTHQCTCPGSCCSAPIVAAPQEAPLAAVVSVAATTAAPREGERQAVWLDFVLPFATAPPVIVG